MWEECVVVVVESPLSKRLAVNNRAAKLAFGGLENSPLFNSQPEYVTQLTPDLLEVNH